MTKKFEKDGVSFLYPDNWKIKYDEVYRELGRVIAVEDSKDSIFIVSLFPLEVPLTLEEYTDNVKNELKSKLKNGKDLDIETGEVNRNILLEPSKGIRLKFFVDNSQHIQDLFIVKGKEKLAVIAIQTVDSNLQNDDRNFQTILDSFKFE